MIYEPDNKKQQGWYVDGENASHQRSSKCDRKKQLGTVFYGAEKDLVDRVFRQLGLVSLVLQLLGIELDEVSVVSWHPEPQAARLTIKRKPPQVKDTPVEDKEKDKDTKTKTHLEK